MNDASASREKILADGVFGIVTTKRVIFRRARDWISGGYRTHIKLSQLISASLVIRHNVIGGVLFAIIAAGATEALHPGAQEPELLAVLAISCGVLAVLSFWGYPIVSINTSGAEQTTTAWHRKEAKSFVEAVRRVVKNR